MNAEEVEKPVPVPGAKRLAKPAPRKRRNYQHELQALAGKVEMALRLLHKCEGLPPVAQVAVEILEGP
jgi:hypothetical protein